MVRVMDIVKIPRQTQHVEAGSRGGESPRGVEGGGDVDGEGRREGGESADRQTGTSGGKPMVRVDREGEGDVCESRRRRITSVDMCEG